MAHSNRRKAKRINGPKKQWPTWATDGPLKMKRVGHSEPLIHSAKVQIRHEIYKSNPKNQKGIRAADTPALRAWSAQPTAVAPPGPPLGRCAASGPLLRTMG